MNNTFKKIAVIGLSAAMVAGTATALTGCNKTPADAGDRTVIYYQASGTDTAIMPYYDDMVKTYNNTQGLKDNVYVQLIPSSSSIGGLDNSLRGNYPYDIVQIPDDEFKSLVLTGQEFFIELDKYLTDEVKQSMDYGEIPAGLLNRFRMNQSPESNTKYNTGEGTATLALPLTNNPQILWYNTSAIQAAGINVVSVAETALDAYNSANGASLKPHGYAEYKEAPFADAISSKNEAGNFVYKVFNNRIAMNWEETRCLARAFINQYGYDAGYLSEWWYNYGWSVGGDCIGWDTATDAYVFTLADSQNNYLAIDDITVNGRNYSAGDVLLYEDKVKVNEDSSLKTSLEGKIYKLPSQRDAILEFNRLAVPTDKQADTGVYGYGVSYDSVENRTSKFTNGKVPFYIESYENSISFNSSMKGNVDIAPLTQYRQYVGGSTYQKNDAAGFENEYLKVIGETYGNDVYTGDLQVENDTPVVGRCTTETSAAGLFIPKNTKNKHYDEAAKFVVWAAGPEAQAILAKSSLVVPAQTDIGLGACAEYENRVVKNSWAASYVSAHGEIGDYTYFTSETWITEWSFTFNKTVREGNMTLSDFLIFVPEGKDRPIQQLADASLKNQRLRMLGR